MRYFFLSLILFSFNNLFADTWLGAGGGIFFPLKSNSYYYTPGIGWNVSIQHNFAPEESNYLGFLVSVRGTENDISDYYFEESTFPVKHNDIQLGLVYKIEQFNRHKIEVGAGFVSKGIEADYGFLDFSQNGNGFYFQLDDKFRLSDFFQIEAALSWNIFNTDTAWGDLEMNGVRIDVLIWMGILSSE